MRGPVSGSQGMRRRASCGERAGERWVVGSAEEGGWAERWRVRAGPSERLAGCCTSRRGWETGLRWVAGWEEKKGWAASGFPGFNWVVQGGPSAGFGLGFGPGWVWGFGFLSISNSTQV